MASQSRVAHRRRRPLPRLTRPLVASFIVLDDPCLASVASSPRLSDDEKRTLPLGPDEAEAAGHLEQPARQAPHPESAMPLTRIRAASPLRRTMQACGHAKPLAPGGAQAESCPRRFGPRELETTLIRGPSSDARQ